MFFSIDLIIGDGERKLKSKSGNGRVRRGGNSRWDDGGRSGRKHRACEQANMRAGESSEKLRSRA